MKINKQNYKNKIIKLKRIMINNLKALKAIKRQGIRKSKKKYQLIKID